MENAKICNNYNLDETIANVALPHMAGSFSVSREESMWILTSYLIASGTPEEVAATEASYTGQYLKKMLE